jgi:hypothetical protein
MAKFVLILPAMLLNALLLAAESKPAAEATDKKPAAEAADKADKKPWTIEATPDATVVEPGQKVGVRVRIVNSTDAKRTVYIRAILWYAKSDNPQIAFPEWSKLAGRGPVITYTPVELSPQESYSHDWTCTVANAMPAAETTFRVGITLKTEQGKPEEVFWSDPVKLTVQRPKATGPVSPVKP